MKAKKLLALAGVSVAGTFFLAACGGGSSNQATYSFVSSALVQQLQMSQVTL